MRHWMDKAIGGAALCAALLGASIATAADDSATTRSATIDLTPSALPTEEKLHNVSELPNTLGEKLTAMDARIDRALPEAEEALKSFLEHEEQLEFGKSFQYLAKGLRDQFLQDPTNRGYIERVRLYLNPPPDPDPEQINQMRQVKAMVNAGWIDVEADDPALWVYQWSHRAGTAEARFEATGPFARNFRLREFQIVRMMMVSEDVAAAWVDETVEMPVSIHIARISQYLLRREDDGFRVWGQRSLDGPRIVSWVGKNTYVWPDQLELMPADAEGF